MNVREEIDRHATEEDRPVLHWLFSRYHLRSNWSFVARCVLKRYGGMSYQTDRIWSPTSEGRILYERYLTEPEIFKK
jgi:hypothetical protein